MKLYSDLFRFNIFIARCLGISKILPDSVDQPVTDDSTVLK